MLTKIFFDVDNFCQYFTEYWSKKLIPETKKRTRKRTMTMSEIMTITIFFHFSGYRTFKDYYLKYVSVHLRDKFPELVSYNRFVELMPDILIPSLTFFKTCRIGKVTGVSFVDSTKLRVCHNRRIHSHKVFNGIAERGKDSVGWYYGFKLHLVINHQGDLLACSLTAGNVDDRNKIVFSELSKNLYGKLFGDKGYVSGKLSDELIGKGIELIARSRSNMKKQVISGFDKLMLKKRALIESVYGNLKQQCQIEHTRHRSPTNFLVNLFSGLIAYTFKDKKPRIKVSFKDLELEKNLVAI